MTDGDWYFDFLEEVFLRERESCRRVKSFALLEEIPLTLTEQ